MHLSDQQVADVGFRLYCLAYADRAEEGGASFAGCELTKVVPRPARPDLIRITLPYLRHLEEAWGRRLETIFLDLEIYTARAEVDALADTLLGCWGHGVTLADRHDEQLTLYQQRTGRLLDPAPFHGGFQEFYDLAEAELEAEREMEKSDDPEEE